MLTVYGYLTFMKTEWYVITLDMRGETTQQCLSIMDSLMHIY